MSRRRAVRRLVTLAGLAVIVASGGCVTHEGVLRTRVASEFACNEDEVSVRPLGGNSYEASCGENSSTYVCIGPNGNACAPPSAVTCVRETAPRASQGVAAAAPTVATEARPAAPRLEPRPTQVAEFMFGSTRADAAAVCERGGGTLGESTDHGAFRVSECTTLPVTISNLTGPVSLAFCDGVLCGIRLAVDGGDGSDAHWLAAIRALGRALVTRYGPMSPGEMARGCEQEIRAGNLARVRTGECSYRGTVLLIGGDLQLGIAGRDGVLRGGLQYRTSEMMRAVRLQRPDAGMGGAEHL